MALILSIDTATTVCSVAVHRDKNLLASQSLYLEKSHATLLATLIEDILSYCGVGIGQLGAVAIAKGPGSYTGLRIGTATAKGICFSHQLPLIGIDTLHALAQSLIPFNHEKALLCPMLDARRMEVYCTLLENNGEEIEPTQAKIIDEESFSTSLSDRKIIFFGNGSEKCRDMIRSENAIFVKGVHPCAANMGILASESYEKEQFEDLAYFEPFYLKEFQPTQPKKK